MEDFEGQKGAVIATSHPVAKAALVRLGAAWPRHIHFPDLLAQARADAGRTGEGGNPTLEEDANDLGEFLIRGHAVGFVELHAFAPSYVTEVSAFPTASLLARTQINHVTVVASMRHTPIKLADTLSQHLLRRLDGTRDRDALIRELTELVRTGVAVPERDSQPVTNLDEALHLLRSGIDANLAHLARAGVLVG
jgi:methyltransferase-like protein